MVNKTLKEVLDFLGDDAVVIIRSMNYYILPDDSWAFESLGCMIAYKCRVGDIREYKTLKDTGGWVRHDFSGDVAKTLMVSDFYDMQVRSVSINSTRDHSVTIELYNLI